MTASASPLDEAELHGLVDGHLEVHRRADVLRRLAASPADRALVEAWQDQNDLLRAAFRGVEREAMPVALDLAPPRLRCIDGDVDRRLAATTIAPLHAPPREAPAHPSRNAIAVAAAVLVVAIGLTGSWLMIDGRDGVVATPPPRAELEATLAERAATALDGIGRGTAGSPALRIPDLSAAGLRLTSVSTLAGEPLVLSYRDASAGRVVLSVAGAPDQVATPPTAVGTSLAWRRSGAAYALAGTLPPRRLRALAESLQDDEGRE